LQFDSGSSSKLKCPLREGANPRRRTTPSAWTNEVKNNRSETELNSEKLE